MGSLPDGLSFGNPISLDVLKDALGLDPLDVDDTNPLSSARTLSTLSSRSDLGSARAPAAASPPEGQKADKDAMKVFVRIRPLLEEEIAGGATYAEGLTTTDSDFKAASAAAFTNKETKEEIGGFAGVLGPKSSNDKVFLRAIMPTIPTVARGGVVSLFCYGHTGSGKTHTIFGTNAHEEGLVQIAARKLLVDLDKEDALPGGKMFLNVTCLEIFNDEVYDILGADKIPCTLALDNTGALQIRRPLNKTDLTKKIPGLKKDTVDPGDQKFLHSTVVTKAEGLRNLSIKNPDDLGKLSTTAIQSRSMGDSGQHDESSRSHCIIQLEVVTLDIMSARDKVEDMKGLIPALKNAMDNVMSKRWNQLLDIESFDGSANTFKLKEYEDENQWFKIKDALEVERSKLEKYLVKAEESVATAMAELTEKMQKHEALGGTLVLIDLAGADRDKRSSIGGVEQAKLKDDLKQTANINKSLLALKECLRAVSKAPNAPKRAPFRRSKLTRILQDALRPSSNSARSNKESESVMVVNVSPSDQMEKMTVNSLRYGQIFRAAAEGDSSAAGLFERKSSTSIMDASKPKPWAADKKAWDLHQSGEVPDLQRSMNALEEMFPGLGG